LQELNRIKLFALVYDEQSNMLKAYTCIAIS